MFCLRTWNAFQIELKESRKEGKHKFKKKKKVYLESHFVHEF